MQLPVETFRSIQMVGDFLADRPSTSLGTVQPSYTSGVKLGNLSSSLLEYAIVAIREALPAFDRQIKAKSQELGLAQLSTFCLAFQLTKLFSIPSFSDFALECTIDYFGRGVTPVGCSNSISHCWSHCSPIYNWW
jgi:hypothetical protein